MKSKCLVPDGHEIRGFMIRLYPNADDVAVLEQIQRDTRYAWNWLVKQTEDTLAANASYALRGSLVGPRPCRPDYDGMEPELAKRAKIEHVVACRAWQVKINGVQPDICNLREIGLAHWLHRLESENQRGAARYLQRGTGKRTRVLLRGR